QTGRMDAEEVYAQTSDLGGRLPVIGQAVGNLQVGSRSVEILLDLFVHVLAAYREGVVGVFALDSVDVAAPAVFCGLFAGQHRAAEAEPSDRSFDHQMPADHVASDFELDLFTRL